MNDQPQEYLPVSSHHSHNTVEQERRLRTLTHLLYGLYAAHWLTGGLTGIIAIIINYMKRADTLGTPYAPHFEWQIRTFWIGLIGYLVGVVLLILVIGVPILWAVGIWVLYRIIKGWLYLYDKKPLLTPRAWF